MGEIDSGERERESWRERGGEKVGERGEREREGELERVREGERAGEGERERVGEREIESGR